MFVTIEPVDVSFVDLDELMCPRLRKSQKEAQKTQIASKLQVVWIKL